MKTHRGRWPLRLYAGLLVTILAVNVFGFTISETLRRLGPEPLGKDIAYSTLVTDRHGKLLRPFITGDGYWRLPAASDDIDPRFLAMLIAYEDKRFYTHRGVDPAALLRAAWQAATHGHVVSGGSTLTMQVARLLEPRPARSIADKLAEMIRALQIERRLSKRQILDLYLALAPYGGNIEGTRAASLAYFGKEPRRLSTAESALLVALPQAPETRRPDRFPKQAVAARNRVIALLDAAGIVNADQAQAAEAEEAPKGRLAFPMLAAHVAERIAKAAPPGAVAQTTIARDLQASLETLARDRALLIGSGVATAILVVDNKTGEVRAHVGGTGYFDTLRAGQMDLANALRSPGSTLKPFIYGLAFEDGLVHPETLIDDRAVRYGAYAPENFDDTFHGTVTVRTALQQSLNVPALQILNAIGADRLTARLANAGVKLVLPQNAAPGLAVGLGGAGVRLTDLAALYVALARGGEPVQLSWQLSETRNARPLRRLFEPNATWMIGDVLKGAPTPQNALGGQIAFKTGTSYGYRDAWAVGYDGANTIAVWVGRPDGAAAPGVVGRIAAAPILFEAFQRIGANRAPLGPAPPGAVIARTNELPANLQRFRPNALPELAAASRDAPPAIAFPPDGARIDLEGDTAPALSLKVYGGTPPFTWLADGIPIAQGEFRRDAFWDQPPHGFARLSVIDARGKTATARVRVE
ncbi:penicillin-binding protein 1C [Aestuariivirga sp.]|uniref:penicillin-binding protein 1C n=1 Tax=Aestuariivirga sp. TaxID=2650926 RepID=UPI0025C5124C|nr:penicillin-binding protein 1C [Aestuariivirga sp.]MCA3555530.1 penicillin-binding protein 1C [Aestuariivirga sp.]